MTVLGFAVVGIWKNPRLPSGDPRRLVYGMDYLGDLEKTPNQVVLALFLACAMLNQLPQSMAPPCILALAHTGLI